MKIISIHEYVLKPSVNPYRFEGALRKARESGLLDLPGLERFYFLKGIRGHRCGGYTAVWVYASKPAWEALWGPEGSPKTKEDYPENWKIWEDQVIAPFLAQDPDKITFTSYQEI